MREIESVVTKDRRKISSDALPPIPYKPEHITIIKDAMYGVTQQGTSTRVFMGAGYQSGGKTGTAQAVGLRQNEKYVASRMDEYKRDHSLYEAFAPVDEPRVALAIIVENAGFGSQAAAPIARRVLDYLLMGQYPSEEDIEAVRQGRAAAPMGVPRKVSEVPLPNGLDAMEQDKRSLPVAVAPVPAAAGSVASGVSPNMPIEAPLASSAPSAPQTAMQASAPASGVQP